MIPQLASPQSVAPMTAALSAQNFLADGGRFLLTLALALFLSYVLFMLGSVTFASALTRMRWSSGGPQPAGVQHHQDHTEVVPASPVTGMAPVSDQVDDGLARLAPAGDGGTVPGSPKHLRRSTR